MDASSSHADDRGWTRARLLRSLACGGAVVAGGAAAGARSGAGTSMAAASKDGDARILNLFLLLEFVQEGFYRAALENNALDGELRDFASTVADQESEHIAFLSERLGNRARERPQSDFGPLLESPRAFRDAAIELEELTIAAFVGQAANLTRRTVGPIATLVSVEARQVAWVRDLAGLSPAPRAADPARTAGAVVADLRKRGFIR